ncbi:hypothetical protein AB0N07_34485 [Streptomyces sp. NPDC051172]|uniref:hypothetical protein n=1 Tax=Streptomyces sp. NPDC051172 TaxID=3155796 RepID=UPI0034218DAF
MVIDLLHGLAAVSVPVDMSMVMGHMKEAIVAMIQRLFFGTAGVSADRVRPPSAQIHPTIDAEASDIQNSGRA